MRILLSIGLVQAALCTMAQAQTVNGCSRATATDLSGQSSTTITFPNGNFTYSPRCIKVDLGAQVTFNGSFSGHPMSGGTVVGGVATPASSGPFLPMTNTGTSKSFTMSSNGDFPYYCLAHGAAFNLSGMVYVGPEDGIFRNDFE